MVGYAVDDEGRLVISAKAYTATALSGSDAPDPATIVAMLDEQQRTVLRITPTKTVFHE